MAAVGVLTLLLQVHGSQSLKEKRQVVRSLKERLRSRFNISIAEVGGQDSWQRAEVGVAVVALDARRAEDLLRKVEEEAADRLGADLVDVELDILM